MRSLEQALEAWRRLEALVLFEVALWCRAEGIQVSADDVRVIEERLAKVFRRALHVARLQEGRTR